MILSEDSLKIDRCPYCSVNNPNMQIVLRTSTTNDSKKNQRQWGIFRCARCGGIVTAAAHDPNGHVEEMYPQASILSDTLPLRVKLYLKQAIDSLHAPAGAVMLCASSVDAMLKDKGYTDGTLNKRINQAATNHLITPDMATWAHHVRLDANDERHADHDAADATTQDAQKCIDFTKALAEILYVLPAKVASGLAQSQNADAQNSSASGVVQIHTVKSGTPPK